MPTAFRGRRTSYPFVFHSNVQKSLKKISVSHMGASLVSSTLIPTVPLASFELIALPQYFHHTSPAGRKVKWVWVGGY